MASYFLPYQERWIRDESQIKLAEKSRRIGFTFAASFRMFQKCLDRGRGFTQWVSSRDELTAQELIRTYIAKWCDLANCSVRGLGADRILPFERGRNIRAFTVEFPGGSRIVSLSSTPEAFAGKGGDVFLDEADLHDHSDRLVDMAFPCITWGGQLEIVSAYRVGGSKFTPFARMVAKAKADNPQNASLHRVTIHDAVAAGLVEKVNESSRRKLTRQQFVEMLKGGCRTLAAWQSQYECVLLDAGDRLLSQECILGCIVEPGMIREVCADNLSAPRFAGFDVARRIHASVWHVYALIGGRLWLEEREVFHDMPFDKQEQFVRTKMRREERRITRCAMDSTGLGMQMAETLSGEFVGRVEGVNLESHRRHEICMIAKDKFEKRIAAIPDEGNLCEDLNAPQLVLAANGNVRVALPQFENESGEVSHADEFIATALAFSAVDNGVMGSASAVDMRGAFEVGRRTRGIL